MRYLWVGVGAALAAAVAGWALLQFITALTARSFTAQETIGGVMSILAVVSILCRMTSWCRGEAPEPYSLADGCQDHLLGLAIEEAGRTGEPVRTAREAWADA